MTRKQGKHDSQLAKIIKNPWLVGIKPQVIAREVTFLGEGRIISEPDIIAIMHGILYNLEYKCNDSPQQRGKAKGQLKRQERFLRELGYSGPIENLYVFGEKFETEVIL